MLYRHWRVLVLMRTRYQIHPTFYRISTKFTKPANGVRAQQGHFCILKVFSILLLRILGRKNISSSSSYYYSTLYRTSTSKNV